MTPAFTIVLSLPDRKVAIVYSGRIHLCLKTLSAPRVRRARQPRHYLRTTRGKFLVNRIERIELIF